MTGNSSAREKHLGGAHYRSNRAAGGGEKLMARRRTDAGRSRRLWHVTSRGSERKNIFRSDADRLLFLALLAEAVKRFRWIVHL